MTAFELGFIKYAQECGLPASQVTHMLKRAADHPDISSILVKEAGVDETSEQLSALTDIYEQNNIDLSMQQLKQQLYS